jgi:hypothetical protein
VRLCSKWDLVPRAWPFQGQDESLVRVRMGTLFYMLSPDEAIEFARQLVAAADEARAADHGPALPSG